jgi:transcriptional regulator with XRE-family HTH domain
MEWNELKKTISLIDENEKKIIEFTADIVDSLIDRRKELNWSQSVLAEKVGMKQSAISRLEGGANIPKLDTIFKVAVALGLKPVFVPDEENNQTN